MQTPSYSKGENILVRLVKPVVFVAFIRSVCFHTVNWNLLKIDGLLKPHFDVILYIFFSRHTFHLAKTVLSSRKQKLTWYFRCARWNLSWMALKCDDRKHWHSIVRAMKANKRFSGEWNFAQKRHICDKINDFTFYELIFNRWFSINRKSEKKCIYTCWNGIDGGGNDESCRKQRQHVKGDSFKISQQRSM